MIRNFKSRGTNPVNEHDMRTLVSAVFETYDPLFRKMAPQGKVRDASANQMPLSRSYKIRMWSIAAVDARIHGQAVIAEVFEKIVARQRDDRDRRDCGEDH